MITKLFSRKALLLRFALIAVLGLQSGLAPSTGWARDQHKPSQQGEKVHRISQAQAAAAAQARYGGKVLKVQRRGATYRVKLLQPSGHVKQVLVDATSGAIIGG